MKPGFVIAFLLLQYNSGFQCPDPLLVYDVISILDSRVAYLGKKTRRLTESEKEFLKSRLPGMYYFPLTSSSFDLGSFLIMSVWSKICSKFLSVASTLLSGSGEDYIL